MTKRMSDGLSIADLIAAQSGAWARRAREDSTSAVGAILRHADNAGKLREPQTRAIETYLWLKFVGDCRRLADLVIGGVLRDDELAEAHKCRDPEYSVYTAAQQFLLCFAGKNDLPKLDDAIRKDLTAKKTDWNKVTRDLLHDFAYPNYFFSLPMGAGKTYLMAAFICLDLHFSRLFGEDRRFARNFVVFAPHAAKTAILPSLRTIREFDPGWILPDNAAAEVRREMKVEILDKPSAAKKSMRVNNPNLERVNRLAQPDSRGLIFITNAEKVVLEKYAPENGPLLRAAKPEEKDAVEKSNELRERFAKIPALGVMLDEGVHAYSASGEDDKKLRAAVGVFHGGGNLRFVLGFSGTPFVNRKLRANGVDVRLSRLQDVVYDFPLAAGIGVFLKIPKVVRNDGVRESRFIRAALGDFFAGHDIAYHGGAKSKIAFYCPSIKALNEDILPAVKKWFAQNRRGKEGEILSFYRKPTGEDKKYALPKEAEADFHNLDAPHSPYRVVLLVAVGKEGWDCKSLTAVALPRKVTTRNFVLQTSCRCLREVRSAKEESALICLGEGNYAILEKQLREQHDLSIGEFGRAAEGDVPVIVRKPKLGTLRYKQVRRELKIVSRSESGGAPAKFKFAEFKKRHDYTAARGAAGITRTGRLRQTNGDTAKNTPSAEAPNGDSPLSSSWRFIAELSRFFWGSITAADLEAAHGEALEKIRRTMDTKPNAAWFAAHPDAETPFIAVREIAALIAGEDEYRTDTVAEDAEIELLKWWINEPKIPHSNLMLPGVEKKHIRRYAKHPERIEEDLEDEGLDPGDMSFNYAPYRFDSEFEKNALIRILQESAQLPGVELYYNGMRRGDLASFYIETPTGRYTPDFLLLRRAGGVRYRKQGDSSPDTAAGKIEKALIIETKAAVFYDAKFKSKEAFVKREFLRYNPQMRYHCFVDKAGENDFSAHWAELKKIVHGWNLR